MERRVKMDLHWYYRLIIIVGGYLMTGLCYALMIVDAKFDAFYKKYTKHEKLAEKYWKRRIDLWRFLPAINIEKCIDTGGAWLIDSIYASKTRREIRKISRVGFWKNLFRWPLVLIALMWALIYWFSKENNLKFASPPKHWIA